MKRINSYTASETTSETGSRASLQVVPLHNHDGVLLVDSRLVAERCNVKHPNILELLRKYQGVIEEAFGTVTFETRPSNAVGGGGSLPIHALLNEEQATFLITLTRNTPQVVAFKCALVKAYRDAKARLQQGANPVSDSAATLAILSKLVDQMASMQTTLAMLVDRGTKERRAALPSGVLVIPAAPVATDMIRMSDIDWRN